MHGQVFLLSHSPFLGTRNVRGGVHRVSGACRIFKSSTTPFLSRFQVSFADEDLDMVSSSLEGSSPSKDVGLVYGNHTHTYDTYNYNYDIQHIIKTQIHSPQEVLGFCQGPTKEPDLWN